MQLARIIKEASASDGSTEVTIALGADRGVVSDSRATVLDGNKDLPLSGGDISITRVERRVTVGVVQLSAKQLHGNTRVRVLPPKLPVPAPSHAPSNAPHGIARIEIQYSFAALHCANAHRYAIDWTPNGYRSDAAKIDTALIDALHSSLTDLTSSDREQTCADHTDDYPSFEVAFGDDPTTPAVVLTSESNCRASNAPWNVLRGGQRFAQDSGAIGNAVHALLEAIDPVRWQPGGDPRFNWYRRCEPSHR